MSYLIRTGTGRTNIKWGGGKSTKAKYLRRTGTGRNNISWIDINSNGTYNVLERTSTGRNNIRWYNTQFSFAVNIARTGIKVGTSFRHVTRNVPAHTTSGKRINRLTVGSINGNAITFSKHEWDSSDGYPYNKTWAYYVYWMISTSDAESIGWDNIVDECNRIKRVSYSGDEFYDVAAREYDGESYNKTVRLIMNTGWSTKNQINLPTVKIE